MQIEDGSLLQLLTALSYRCRYILFARISYAHSFEKMAEELDMSYSAVISIYDRTAHGIRKNLKDGGDFGIWNADF